MKMTFYLFGASLYCAFLLLLIFKHQQNLKITSKSWLVIFIASTFWVLVLPISLLEIVIKDKSQPYNRNKSELYGRGKSRIPQETPQ